MKGKFIFLTIYLFFVGEMFGAAAAAGGAGGQVVITHDDVETRGLLVFLERACHRRSQLVAMGGDSAESRSIIRRYNVYIEKLSSEIGLIYGAYLAFLRSSDAKVKEMYDVLVRKTYLTDKEMELSEIYERELARINGEIRRVHANLIRVDAFEDQLSTGISPPAVLGAIPAEESAALFRPASVRVPKEEDDKVEDDL
jgi:hypothetical protein